MQLVFDTKHVRRRWVCRGRGMPCSSSAATDYEAVARDDHMKHFGCGWTYRLDVEMSADTYARAQAGQPVTLS